VGGGEQAFRDGLLPQLVPLFTCPIALRAAYGNAFHSEAASAPGGSSSVTAGGAARAASGRVTTQDAGGDEDGDAGGDAGHGDSGYWDLVYILYPEAVETVGLEEAHDFVPGWEALEHALKVGNLNPLALHHLAMQEARCAELEDCACTAQCCYWRSHEGQVWRLSMRHTRNCRSSTGGSRQRRRSTPQMPPWPTASACRSAGLYPAAQGLHTVLMAPANSRCCRHTHRSRARC